MGNFFIKLFVKDYRNTSDPRVRERYGKFAGVVGIVSNLLLCMIKILAGVFSASIAIIADGRIVPHVAPRCKTRADIRFESEHHEPHQTGSSDDQYQL